MAAFDPSNKDADLVLSNSNRTGTIDVLSTAASASVFGDTAITSGKYVIEYEADYLTDGAMSVCVASPAVGLGVDIGDSNLWGYSSSGNARGNGVSATLSPYSAGDVVSIAIDTVAQKVWFAINGVWSGDPGAGTGASFSNLLSYGGSLKPYVILFSHLEDPPPAPISVTAAFTGSDLQYPLPSGFAAWDGTTNGPAANDTATAPISVIITPTTGTATAPIRVGITGSGAAYAPIRVAILDSLETRNWSAVVTLGGVDVSARLVGVLDVDAEAGAARVAGFTLRPAAGVVSPLAWVGAAVTIDLVRVVAGVDVPARLFTGVVDVASFDPTTSLVRFACTDDIQNRVAALSKDDIDTLTTGARYHAGAQGEIDEHWDYAQARMETLPASLDSGPSGTLRVTPWDGLATWATFTESDILDQSLSIDLPRRTDLINRVDIAYQYRFYRCRERRASLAWSKSSFGTQALAGAYQYPSQDMIESALDGLGWQRLSTAYANAPASVALASPAGWYVACTGVSNMSATLGQRHAQTITEAYTLSVLAPDSIALHGELARPLRGALASQWTPDEWEADWTVTTPDASASDVSYAGDENRFESNACILTLLAMARVQILAAHRKTRLGFSISCLPELDLVHAVEVDTAALAATGKVDRVQHTLDIDAGEATTRVTLALSGVELTGTVSPDTLAAPTAPDVDAETGTDDWVASLPNLSNHLGAATISSAYSDTLMGYLYNAPESYAITDGTDTDTAENTYYDAAEAYPTTGFRVAMPGVADTHRNPLEIESSAEYDIAIPRDTLTQTVS